MPTVSLPPDPARSALLPVLTARLGDVPEAFMLAAAGHLHLATLVAAAARQGIGAQIEAVGAGRAARVMVRLDLPANRVAWCHGGRIVIGPTGADPTGCRPLNGDTARLTAHKPTLNHHLATLGFSVPPGQVFSAPEREAALQWARANSPVCLKPPSGSLGWGVTPGLRDEDAVGAAFDTVAERCGSVLLEQHVSSGDRLPPGATLRFMWLETGDIFPRMDVPAHLTGDGASTVETLLMARNASRAAQTGQPPILPDAALLARLRQQGLTLRSVPATGQRVALRMVSNASQGGDSHTTLPTLHPSYAEEIDRLFRTLPGGQTRAGAADMVVVDPTTPCHPDNHWILDVNLSPGIIQHHFPWSGPPQDVAAGLITLLRQTCPR